MRIAHLVPASIRFPLQKHNGRYEWVLRLARLQAAAGHQVVVYCAKGSNLDDCGLQVSSLDAPTGTYSRDNRALLRLAFASNDFEIFHSHFDSLHYELAHLTQKPVVVTQHWFPNEKLAAAAAAAGHPNNVIVVPVTHYMEAADARLGIPATHCIYHGIDLELFAPNLGAHSDRLVFVGRIAPHKGAVEAVRLAQATGSKLDIIGKVNAVDQEYWSTASAAIDGVTIRYLGGLPQAAVAEAMRQARALLFPNQSLEAFGQTIIEAQACGTPVITQDNGAAGELIDTGRSGFVAATSAEYIHAIQHVSELDPRACRRQAEKFDIHTMVQNYDRLYASLL